MYLPVKQRVTLHHLPLLCPLTHSYLTLGVSVSELLFAVVRS